MFNIQGRHEGALFRVLDCVNYISGDPNGYYRILVTEPTRMIKYLCFNRVRSQELDHNGARLAFEHVPHGNWNCATLQFNPATRKYNIASFQTLSLQTISLKTISKWHDKTIDVLSLREAVSGFGDGEVQCQDKLLSSIRPSPGQVEDHFRRSRKGNRYTTNYDTVFVETMWWPTDVYGPEKETKIHMLLRGHNFVPEFLAHVTENQSRIIGYMTEHVPGRVATEKDLKACKEVLMKLHGLGYVYGDVSADGFLVADDKRRGVLLHSFGAVEKTQDRARFDAELNLLEKVLTSDGKKRRREKRGHRL